MKTHTRIKKIQGRKYCFPHKNKHVNKVILKLCKSITKLQPFTHTFQTLGKI